MEFLGEPEPGGESRSGRGAIIMAEYPKSKEIVLLISGNSSLNGKAATEEFLEHLDFVLFDFSVLKISWAMLGQIVGLHARQKVIRIIILLFPSITLVTRIAFMAPSTTVPPLANFQAS